MTGKLDEISRAIGNQEANIKGLGRSFDKHCEDDDRRHSENIEELRAISAQMRELNETLRPVVASVNVMRPIVDGYKASRLKAAGALSLASTMLVAVGWLVTSLAGEAVKWVLARLH